MRYLALLLTLGASVACSSFDAEESDGGGADAAAKDAGGEGGSTPGADAGGSSSGQSSGQPPLAALGFEEGRDCPNWLAVNSVKSSSPQAHTGAASCSVCISAAGSFSFHGPTVDSSAAADDVYVAKAWVKATDGPLNARVVLHAVNSASGIQLSESGANAMSVNSDWTELTATLKIASAATAGATVDVYIAVDNAASGACVVVDDVVVAKQ